MVLALLTVAALLAIPRFDGVMQRLKVDADARQLAFVLRNARQEAISAGTAQVVYFYTEDTKYKWKSHATYYLSPGVRFLTTTSFGLIDNKKACCFTPSGAPARGGTVVIGCGSYAKYIIVNPVAGRVRIDDQPPDNWGN